MSHRSSYKTTFKLQVIEFADTHGKYGAAWHFGINKSNVRLWGRSQLDKMPKSKRANIEVMLPFMKSWKVNL